MVAQSRQGRAPGAVLPIAEPVGFAGGRPQRQSRRDRGTSPWPVDREDQATQRPGRAYLRASCARNTSRTGPGGCWRRRRRRVKAKRKEKVKMPIGLQDAEPQRDFGANIPDGTFCKVKLAIKPGSYSLPNMDAADAGLFKQAKPPSDAVMLEGELTVLPPSPHAKRKIFQMWTIGGGKLDEKGQSIAWNITKSSLRAMIDSACGLDPADASPQATTTRVLQNFRSLD